MLQYRALAERNTVTRFCHHGLNAVTEDHVTLTVTVMDVTQDWNDLATCPYYRLEVRDGDDAEAPLMGSYCGSRAPPHLTTQGSAMFVQVMSLLGGSAGTFTAMYSVLSSSKLTSHFVKQACILCSVELFCFLIHRKHILLFRLHAIVFHG
jgi:hypothetical protein